MIFNPDQLLYFGVTFIAIGFVYLMLKKKVMIPRCLVGTGLYMLALYILWKDKLATIANAMVLAIIFLVLISIPILRSWAFPKTSIKSRKQ